MNDTRPKASHEHKGEFLYIQDLAWGEKDKPNVVADSCRRAVSFRFPAKSSVVAASQDDLKGKNCKLDPRSTISEMDIGKWENGGGYEFDYDEENQSCHSMDSQARAALAHWKTEQDCSLCFQPLQLVSQLTNICSSLGASSVSGFFAAACSLPFDYVKTQIQKMQPDADGKYPYTGSVDCALKTLKAGGPLKFYTGFPVYCVRIAPHVMMTWIFLNQIQKLQKTYGL
ncbi:Mitochondrial dicarboxylate/tricarboxylate transporter DTC, partial [Mucuna pruriens]